MSTGGSQPFLWRKFGPKGGGAEVARLGSPRSASSDRTPSTAAEASPAFAVDHGPSIPSSSPSGRTARLSTSLARSLAHIRSDSPVLRQHSRSPSRGEPRSRGARSPSAKGKLQVSDRGRDGPRHSPRTTPSDRGRSRSASASPRSKGPLYRFKSPSAITGPLPLCFPW